MRGRFLCQVGQPFSRVYYTVIIDNICFCCSDPFVVIECVGLSPRRTAVVTNTLRPTFEQTFVFPVSAEESVIKCKSLSIA